MMDRIAPARSGSDRPALVLVVDNDRDRDSASHAGDSDLDGPTGAAIVIGLAMMAGLTAGLLVGGWLW